MDAAVAGPRERGTKSPGDVVTSEDAYRLCSVRRPEGIVVVLAEQLG